MGVGLGDPAEVMRSYQQAVETEEAGLRTAPDETNALHSYAVDLLFLADAIKETGNLQEAQNDYSHVLEIAKIVSQRTGSARRLRDVAVAHNRLGELYETERNWRKALDQDEQSLEIYRQLIDRDPNDFVMRQGMAIAVANVGIQNERIAPNRGLPMIQESVAMMEAIVATNKENAQQRGILASLYVALGDALMSRHRSSDALAEYQKGLIIYEKLSAGDPRNTDAVHSMAVCRASIGDVLAGMGKLRAASQSFLAAIAA